VVSACSTVARRSALLGSFQVAVGKYMLALYRCGRRGDALAAFHRLRRALIDELGLVRRGLRGSQDADAQFDGAAVRR
jgi:hypothetical protein